MNIKCVDDEFDKLYDEMVDQFKNISKQKVEEYIIEFKNDDTIDIKLKTNLLSIYLYMYKNLLQN